MLELLGEGGFEKVFRVYDKRKNRLLACKISSNSDFNKNLQEMLAEDKLLSAVEEINENNNFISYIGLFKDCSLSNKKPKLIILMESGEINLFEILKFRKKYELKEVLYIFNSLVSALLLLQENGIAIRDVKSQNIILIPNNSNPELFYYKISDFGIGCFLKPGETEIDVSKLLGMSDDYAAPEIVKIFYNRKYDKKTYDPFKADVYSLAIVILELMNVTKNEFTNGKLGNHILGSLLNKMLEEEISERLNFNGVKIELNKIIENQNLCPPIEEKKYINKYNEWKLNGKLIEEKINEYLRTFNAYYDIDYFRLAQEK